VLAEAEADAEVEALGVGVGDGVLGVGVGVGEFDGLGEPGELGVGEAEVGGGGVGLVLCPPPVVGPPPPVVGGLDGEPGALTASTTRVAPKNADHQTVAVFTVSPVRGDSTIRPSPM
jgi:hypothetical protein